MLASTKMVTMLKSSHHRHLVPAGALLGLLLVCLVECQTPTSPTSPTSPSPNSSAAVSAMPSLEPNLIPANLTTTISSTIASTTKKTSKLHAAKPSITPSDDFSTSAPKPVGGKWKATVGKDNELHYQLNCTPTSMSIEVNLTGVANPFVYLERLKSFSICRPKMSKSVATFHLSLEDDFYRCGTTKVHDQATGTRVYYNHILVESKSNSSFRRSIYFKCSLPSAPSILASLGVPNEEEQLLRALHEPGHNNNRQKRELITGPGKLVNFTELDLPENFMEAEVLDFTDNITARAPYPHLNIRVLRDGRVVNTTLNVAPGTALDMMIYLDEVSAPVYGLLATYLKVTDAANSAQQEVIVLNGCSIDPYIFGNFESAPGGDAVSARFRAFKFPDSSYVMFIGTVNVCLNECVGVPCANDVTAYGRRRRRRAALPKETKVPSDPNKVYEIEMSTYLKIGWDEKELQSKKGSLLGEAPSAPVVVSSARVKPARLTSSMGSAQAQTSGTEHYTTNNKPSLFGNVPTIASTIFSTMVLRSLWWRNI